MFFFTEFEINDICLYSVTAWFVLLGPPMALPLPPGPVQWPGITLGACWDMCLGIMCRGRGLWRPREPPARPRRRWRSQIQRGAGRAAGTGSGSQI